MAQWWLPLSHDTFVSQKQNEMVTKKAIAIIGATGNMGTAIAKSLAKGKDHLLLMAGNADKLDTLSNELQLINKNVDIEKIQCAVNASWEADIIILAVPYPAEKEIAEKIREVSTGKIIISISNPLNPAFDGLMVANGTSAAEELQQALPYSKVIKAFNTTFAADFYTPVIEGKQTDSFIAGDDTEALETVAEIVKLAGFNPVITGGLQVSRTLEVMQLLMIQLNLKYNYNWLAGWKILH
jgi:NADPH-dependent F420 reductase